MLRYQALTLSEILSKVLSYESTLESICSATLLTIFALVLGLTQSFTDDDAMKGSLVNVIHLLVPWRTWVKTSWPERRDASKRAAALEIYNAEFSPIYKLPLELNSRFLHHISRADMMSLRSTSRRFRSRTRRQKPTWHDINDMKARLQRDYYHKLVEAEPTDITTLSELVCSYCRQPHPRSLFQCEEAIKSPHIRWCIGWSRIFRACSHVSGDRIWVLDCIFGTGHPKSKRVNPLCDRCNMNFFLDRQYCNNHVIYGVESVLSIYHIGSTIFRVAIQNDLRRLAAIVCPHMRTDDPDFLERVLSSP
jgi:hypothetical protein